MLQGRISTSKNLMGFANGKGVSGFVQDNYSDKASTFTGFIQDEVSTGSVVTSNDFSGYVQDDFAPTVILKMGGGSSGMNSSYHTLTSMEFSAKGFQLSPVPLDVTQVFVNIVGGVQQYISLDFTVSVGGFLGWNGLQLDGLVHTGSIFVVTY